MDYRIGHGFDVHRLVEGRKCVIGGVEIPYDRGLDGHSDADVAIHALCDALLGAAALGDIGFHFPDYDPDYENISSRKLLYQVASMIYASGFKPVNIDLTIIAQEPKLAKYIPRMRHLISIDLGIPIDCVSVKATTTERLGFTGRGEGIAAEAVVLLRLEGERVPYHDPTL